MPDHMKWREFSRRIQNPLHRHAQMLKRPGITLDRSTLSDWVGRACWWLTPLCDLVLTTVLSSGKMFADETRLPVLDPGRGKTKAGRLSCCAVDDRPWAGSAAAYVYSEDRKGTHPAPHLAAFKGRLPRLPGWTDLAKAMRDLLRHFEGLIVYLGDGRVEMDSNVVECAIRLVTITRKNSLFAGSDDGAAGGQSPIP